VKETLLFSESLWRCCIHQMP